MHLATALCFSARCILLFLRRELPFDHCNSDCYLHLHTSRDGTLFLCFALVLIILRNEEGSEKRLRSSSSQIHKVQARETSVPRLTPAAGQALYIPVLSIRDTHHKHKTNTPSIRTITSDSDRIIYISVIMRLSNTLLLLTLPVRTYHEQSLDSLGLDFG
jgi:hypothetical protein